MKITETILSVRDMDAAVRFYTETLGFRLAEREEWGWAVIEDNGQCIGLVLDKWMRDEGTQEENVAVPHIGVKSENIDTEVAALRSKGLNVGDPKGDKGSTRTTVFQDPSGNRIFLWSDT